MTIYQTLQQKLSNSVQSEPFQSVMVGLFLLANLPLITYFDRYSSPESRLLLVIRTIGVSLAIVLALKPYWPRQANRYFPIFWYTALLYCLVYYPVMLFFIYFSSMISISAAILNLFLLLLIVNWLGFILLTSIGSGLAVLTYFILIQPIHHYAWVHFLRGFTYFETHPYLLEMFLWMMVASLLFSRYVQRTRERTQLAKQMYAMRSIAASIAHELRTPLLAIRFGLQYALNYIKRPNIEETAHVITSVQAADQEIVATNQLIDMVLTKLNPHVVRYDYQLCSIQDCIKGAITRYPYRSEEERGMVQWLPSAEFTFYGVKLLMIHVVFNLLKNALYSLHEAEKGVITLWTTVSKQYNELHVKDTGTGIKREELANIFQIFYGQSKNGTGVGLCFCQMVMEGLGGKIVCGSKWGEFTEFTLKFPRLEKQARSFKHSIKIENTKK